MSVGTILLILLILILVGAIPNWHGAGFAPSGIIGVIVIVLIILLIMGKI